MISGKGKKTFDEAIKNKETNFPIKEEESYIYHPDKLIGFYRSVKSAEKEYANFSKARLWNQYVVLYNSVASEENKRLRAKRGIIQHSSGDIDELLLYPQETIKYTNMSHYKVKEK